MSYAKKIVFQSFLFFHDLKHLANDRLGRHTFLLDHGKNWHAGKNLLAKKDFKKISEIYIYKNQFKAYLTPKPPRSLKAPSSCEAAEQL